ncbi:MAG: 3-deoxy-manno-octulosonate cytidylyltransferase [Legionellales bacterium]|nr:3-deoxy-manno-octulosonate cytidylyltransferase [Legionellales bacterium]
MSAYIIIPARLASTRLASKVLLDIAGKPMLQHVYEKACQADVEGVFIATDDLLVKKTAEAFGATVFMTASHHQSGTERLAEVVQIDFFQDEDRILNLQGDEPLIPVSILNQVLTVLAEDEQTDVASLATPILSYSEFCDANVTKVIVNPEGYAQYFSRAPIPWPRDAFRESPAVLPADFTFLRHIGLYAQRVQFLKRYAKLTPSPWESLEYLEQLRVLWHGGKIKIALAEEIPPRGVDTAEDLELVRKRVLS